MRRVSGQTKTPDFGTWRFCMQISRAFQRKIIKNQRFLMVFRWFSVILCDFQALFFKKTSKLGSQIPISGLFTQQTLVHQRQLKLKKNEIEKSMEEKCSAIKVRWKFNLESFNHINSNSSSLRSEQI